VSSETAARPRPLRLTQARIGDTLYDANSTRVEIVNAFTTLNPETEVTVRGVDYHVVGAAAPDQFRVYSDDERGVARWWRVETPQNRDAGSVWTRRTRARRPRHLRPVQGRPRRGASRIAGLDTRLSMEIAGVRTEILQRRLR